MAWGARLILVISLSFSAALAKPFPGGWTADASFPSIINSGSEFSVTITYYCTTPGYVYFPIDLVKGDLTLTCGDDASDPRDCLNELVVMQYFGVCNGEQRVRVVKFKLPSAPTGQYSAWIGYWEGDNNKIIKWMGSDGPFNVEITTATTSFSPAQSQPNQPSQPTQPNKPAVNYFVYYNPYYNPYDFNPTNYLYNPFINEPGYLLSLDSLDLNNPELPEDYSNLNNSSLFTILLAAAAGSLIIYKRRDASYVKSLFDKAGSAIINFFSKLFSHNVVKELQGTYVPLNNPVIDNQVLFDYPKNNTELSNGAVIGNVISDVGKSVLLGSGLSMLLGVVLCFTPATAPAGALMIAIGSKAFIGGVVGWGAGEVTYFVSRGLQAEAQGSEEDFAEEDHQRLAGDILQASAMAVSYGIGKVFQGPLKKIVNKLIEKGYYKQLMEITYTDDGVLINHKGVITKMSVNDYKKFLIDDIIISVSSNRRVYFDYTIAGLDQELCYPIPDGYATPAAILPVDGTSKFVLIKFDNAEWSQFLIDHDISVIAHELLGETAANLGFLQLQPEGIIKLPEGLDYRTFLSELAPDVIASNFIDKSLIINSRISAGGFNWWTAYPDIVAQVKSIIPDYYSSILISNNLVKGSAIITGEVIQ